VRTTLKRGHGRTALDGRGSDRSTLPPDALSPMTIYTVDEPPSRSGFRTVGRILGWIGLVLLMVAGGFAGGIYLWLHESVAAVQIKGPDYQKIRPFLTKPPKGPAIWLALGYDHRAGQGSDPSRSDTMMLLRTDPDTHTVSMLSFPRDLQTQIYCPGHAVWTDKINAAFSCGSANGGGPIGGAAAALETVEKLTGLPVNYLITVDFFGFKKIVNILGGVWVDVDRRYFNNQGGPYGYSTINLQPGYQKLSGGAALAFVRYRHTDSDIIRTDRQQQFMQELKQQFKQSFSLDKIPGLVDSISGNVKIGLPGSSSISIPFVEKYGQFAKDLSPGGYCQAKIAGLTGYSDLTTDPSNITAAVQQFMAPCGKQAGEANAAALNLKVKAPKVTVPKPAQTSIVVLNGNGVAGAAADANYRLLQRGYKMQQPIGGQLANAPSHVFHTTIYYESWSKRGKAAAASLAQVMAPADVKAVTPELRGICGGSVMLCVVVGTTYHNALTPPPAAQPVIKHQAPSVYFARSTTEPYALQAQRSVPFKVLVPTVLESSSIPDTYGGDPPLRVYHITDKFKAVRFVFRRPSANEYWGVEETNWQGAPVLTDRNFHRKIGGRTYWFYYHGARLHMVVLQLGGVGYWVVNTLADSLSSETMIAIAKGLQPLSAGPAKSKR
jgi:LCP family protein required for cell wall assembly